MKEAGSVYKQAEVLPFYLFYEVGFRNIINILFLLAIMDCQSYKDVQ